MQLDQEKSFLFKVKPAWKRRSLHLSLFMNFVIERFLYAAINSAIRCNRWYETRFIPSAFAVCMTWPSEPVHSPAIGRIRAGPPGPSAMKDCRRPRKGELVRGAVGELQGAGRWPAARARPHLPRLSDGAAGRVAFDRADRKPRQATVSLGATARARAAKFFRHWAGRKSSGAASPRGAR
jgi:hypothetical protein